MPKDEITFDNFLQEVDLRNINFVRDLHDFILQNNCSFKIETAKSGYVLSYNLPKTKKVIANYVFRKNGLIIRIYGDNVNKYEDFLQTLPENMITAIKKAPVCKRLIDPTKCNSRCPLGNVFNLNGKIYQNCRYSSFMFEVNEENHAAIRDFMERELKDRLS